VSLRLKLADAEPPYHGDRVFLVLVLQQPQRCWLRRELVAGQDAELGQTPERVAGGSVIRVLTALLPFCGNAQQAVDEHPRAHGRESLLQALGKRNHGLP